MGMPAYVSLEIFVVPPLNTDACTFLNSRADGRSGVVLLDGMTQASKLALSDVQHVWRSTMLEHGVTFIEVHVWKVRASSTLRNCFASSLDIGGTGFMLGLSTGRVRWQCNAVLPGLAA